MQADLERVYNLYSATVFRVALLYFRDRSTADDVTHDTFIKYATSSKVFKDDAHVKAWLITVARSICLNKLKRDKWQTELLDTHTYVETFDEVISEVMKLNVDDRLAVYMFYYEEYPTKVIAQLLNSTDAAVRARLKRARKQLRDILED